MAKTIFGKDQITIDERNAHPGATPPAGQVQLYGYNKGMYMKNADGVVSPLSANAPAFAYIGQGSIGNTPVAQWDVALPTGYEVLRFLFRLKNDNAGTTTRHLYGKLDNISAANTYSWTGDQPQTGNKMFLVYHISNMAVEQQSFIWMDVHYASQPAIPTIIETRSFSTYSLKFMSYVCRRNAAEVNSTLNLYLNADSIVNSSYTLWGLRAL